MTKSWIMQLCSTPSTARSGWAMVPSAATTAQVRYGSSMS